MPNWTAWYDKAKSMAMSVTIGYLEIGVPLAVFFVFNVCADAHTRDVEKFGLLWLKYSETEPEERAAKFPTPTRAGVPKSAVIAEVDE
jgi:hypothetical protein